MEFHTAPAIFEQFPDFNAGIIAVKGIDNETEDEDIEAFLRHASLEAGLLLNLKPLSSDSSVQAYRKALAKAGIDPAAHLSTMEAGLLALKEGIAQEQQAGTSAVMSGMTGFIGMQAFERKTPAEDLAAGAELQFRMPVLPFDIGKNGVMTLRPAEAGDTFTARDGKAETLRAGEPVFVLNQETAARRFFCDMGEAGRVTEDTRHLLLVIPCFAVNRRRAMSVRNELARRVKDSFGRAAEMAWIDEAHPSYVSEI